MTGEIVFHAFTGGDGTGSLAVALPAARGKLRDSSATIGAAFSPVTAQFAGHIVEHGAINASLPRMLSRTVDGANRVGAVLPAMRAKLQNTALDVTLQIVYARMPAMRARLRGHIIERGVIDATLPAARGRLVDEANRVGGKLPVLTAQLADHPLVARYVYILQSPGYALIRFGAPAAAVYDHVSAADSAVAQLTVTVGDRARANERAQAPLSTMAAAADGLVARDTVSVLQLLLAESSVAAADSPEAYLSHLAVLVDVAMALDAALSPLTALLAVATLGALHDTALAVDILTAESGGDLVDDPSFSRIELLASAVDSVVADASAGGFLTVFAFVADDAAIADTVASQLDMLAAAFDSGEATSVIRIGDDTFATYAMTLRGAAVTEYAGVRFNSQAVIDGQLYIADESGVYLFDGNDDAGANIDASVYLGLSALGTQLKKAVPAAYFGYTATGTLLLKVITTDAGVKRVNVYKLSPVVRNATADNRITPSKGLHAVYWGFELANYEGADFELDTVQVWRMALNRRK